jgi:hypothetical protein
MHPVATSAVRRLRHLPGSSSEAEIRGRDQWYEWEGVHVDGCAPVIADNLIFSPFGMYGIWSGEVPLRAS